MSHRTTIWGSLWEFRNIKNSSNTRTSTDKGPLSLHTNDGKVIPVELEVQAQESILGKGGNGTVFRAVVSPAIQGHSTIAIKVYKDMNNRNIEKECHSRIVREYGSCSSIREMLGYFDYGGAHYLCFVLVRADLEKQWCMDARSTELKRVYTYPRELKFIDAFLRDCARFHKRFSHSDVHPRNISRRGDGSFVLIDWAHLRGKDEKIWEEPWSSEFASPSCKGSMISPKTCDVWSLACFIIVHLTWLKEGPAAVENFMKERKKLKRCSISKGPVDTTPYFHDGDVLHSAVQDQLNWLREDFPAQVTILEAMLFIDHTRRIDMAVASVEWSKTLDNTLSGGCIPHPCLQRGSAPIIQRTLLQVLHSRGESCMWQWQERNVMVMTGGEEDRRRGGREAVMRARGLCGTTPRLATPGYNHTSLPQSYSDYYLPISRPAGRDGGIIGGYKRQRDIRDIHGGHFVNVLDDSSTSNWRCSRWPGNVKRNERLIYESRLEVQLSKRLEKDHKSCFL